MTEIGIPKHMVHVFAHALPIGESFYHRGKLYEKVEDEYATETSGKRWVFEPHYGCIIAEKRAQELGLSPNDYRPL